MSYQQKLNKIGATPGKLALVAVLVVVLVLVIGKQLPKSVPGDVVVAQVTQKQSKAKKAEPKVLTTKFSRGPNKLPAWPEVDFAGTLASNPFALPSWAARAKPVATATQEPVSGELAELKELGATIIVIGKEKKTATIGDEKYHIGDTLEGYQVTDITTHGIILNKLDPH